MKWILISAILMTLVAGCVGPETPVDSADTETSDTLSNESNMGRGGLDVYVLDPALWPLAGALVTLANNMTATTNGDGHAAFDDLPAGTMLITVSLDGYRTATSSAMIEADDRVQANVKLLRGETTAAGPAGNESYRQQFHFRGYFDCSATYFIITGDCMLLIDTVTESAGFGTPVGNMTDEEFTLDFPLDHGWSSVVGEMYWDASAPGSGEQMTFALEPTEYNSTGHAPKYARAEGGSPLRWVVHAGQAHESATTSADGDEPDMPNEFGGEVVRARSFVAGQFLHRPAGTTFLGVGAAISQEFEVFVTVFYGDTAPEDYSVYSVG